MTLLPKGTAIKHPVSDQVKPSFVIFCVRVPGCQILHMTGLTWHRTLYSCIHMATVSVKGLKSNNGHVEDTSN